MQGVRGCCKQESIYIDILEHYYIESYDLNFGCNSILKIYYVDNI